MPTHHDPEDSKELAVLRESFVKLYHYIMGNGREGKLAKMEREAKEAIREVRAENAEALATVHRKLDSIETRLGRVMLVIVALAGGSGSLVTVVVKTLIGG